MTPLVLWINARIQIERANKTISFIFIKRTIIILNIFGIHFSFTCGTFIENVSPHTLSMVISRDTFSLVSLVWNIDEVYFFYGLRFRRVQTVLSEYLWFICFWSFENEKILRVQMWKCAWWGTALHWRKITSVPWKTPYSWYISIEI